MAYTLSGKAQGARGPTNHTPSPQLPVSHSHLGGACHGGGDGISVLRDEVIRVKGTHVEASLALEDLRGKKGGRGGGDNIKTSDREEQQSSIRSAISQLKAWSSPPPK